MKIAWGVGGAVLAVIAGLTGFVLLVVLVLVDEQHPAMAAGALRSGAVPQQYRADIETAAAACSAPLSPAVLAAQLRQESGFRPRATSSAGAQGIAQFMPGTWERYKRDGNGNGAISVWEPADAIAAQGAYMCGLLKTAKKFRSYDGSPIELALAGYNAGFGAVHRYRGVPPQSFASGQTYTYVRTIMASVRKMTAPAEQPGAADLPGGFDVPSDAPAQVRTAVAWALKQRGGWYKLGGDCTDALGSSPARWCDCSSLMQQSYRAAGVDIPRVTYDQVNVGTRVDLDEVKPGDMVFNAGSDGSDQRPGHVGMYVGDNLVVEAPRTGVKTRLVTYSSWRTSTSPMTRITDVRRVVSW